MNKFQLLKDEDLIEEVLKIEKLASKNQRYVDSLNEVKEELKKRLLMSRISIGLLSAIYHEVDEFSSFDMDGFKDDSEILDSILYHVVSHYELIEDIISGDVVLADAEILADRNINSSGEIFEDNDDDDQE